VIEIKVPFYSALVTGDAGVDFVRRARQFHAAAVSLPEVTGADHNWPRLALLGHAAELALLAFLSRSKGSGATEDKAPRHDLAAHYQLAIKRGFPKIAQSERALAVLSEMHRTHYARYPKMGGAQAMISSFDDLVCELIESAARVPAE